MKVSVITRHAITNYGSFLQAYATQEVIKELGFSCEIIDYVRTDEDYRNIEKTILSLKPEWNNSRIKRLLYLIMREPESWLAGKRFEQYRNRYLAMSKRYSSVETLRKDLPCADCYMTGSDQVWGPIGTDLYDDVYFLSFVNDDAFKLSYAASFGRTDKNIDIDNHFKNLLQGYKEILVREESAVNRIEEMGLSAKQVIDPTLLLSRDYWLNRIKEFSEKKTAIRRKYVLVYQLHNNSYLNIYASELAKRYNLDLIRVSPSLHQINRGGRFVFCPEPFTFLDLISGASCMITDSFHGTAFAINLNTHFIEVLPHNSTNTRNISILKLTGLDNRILTNPDNYDLYEHKIDFEKVNKILYNERKKSSNILKQMLEGVKQED